MFFIAWRNLFQEKGRLLISIGGVAFSVTLIVVLAGLYKGWQNKIGEYIHTIPADIWVMQSGSEELFHTPSVLPLSMASELTKVNSVASAKPFNARRLVLQVNGKELNLYVVAYDSKNDVGKPAKVVEGKSVPDAGEIIIDRSQQNKVKIGDTINVAQDKLKVVGFAEGGDLVTSSFAFAQKDELNKIQKLPNAANFFLVQVSPGTNVDSVVNNIKSSNPNVNAVTKDTFVKNNTKIITDTFLPVILVLLLIGVAVGIAIIGLTIYTSTIEKAKEYGVLKAMGIKNRQLYSIVMEQALIAGVLGYIIGILLAYILSITVGKYVAQFVTQFQLVDIGWIFGLTILMSVIAAYIPIRRIAHIDPAEVFKA
jgi:putative ABC transport system permease protein